jgi:transcriptional regulator with XRE-family HTH domain
MIRWIQGGFVMNQKNVGEKIAQRRKELGMTQAVLAEKLQVTNKAVSKWETGEGYPDITLIKKLSSFLEISVDELLEEQVSSQGVNDSIKLKNPRNLYQVLIHSLIVMTFFLPFISFNFYMFDIDALPGVTLTKTGFQFMISNPNNIQTLFLILGLYVIVLISILKVIHYLNVYTNGQKFFDFLMSKRVSRITQNIGVFAIIMLWIATYSQGPQIGLVLFSVLWGVSILYDIGYKLYKPTKN